MLKDFAKLMSVAFAAMLVVALAGCSASKDAEQEGTVVVESSREAATIENAEDAKALLVAGNEYYVANDDRTVTTSLDIRQLTAENGQHPYAVVVTCSDSRVPAEHIFNAGIGELFVIRTAGNVVGEFELGSVEYGAEHLGCPLVVVLGHTHCGAVDAALNGGAHGNIVHITDEITAAIGSETDPRAAEEANVRAVVSTIESSEIMAELIENGDVEVAGAIYDIEAGTFRFI